ncbi:hypothetical protein SUGI_0510040 [Cryptomeria japonica]|nr:hypothetical protein SUGI_0510040 [Cryptomeria japonica]
MWGAQWPLEGNDPRHNCEKEVVLAIRAGSEFTIIGVDGNTAGYWSSCRNTPSHCFDILVCICDSPIAAYK